MVAANVPSQKFTLAARGSARAARCVATVLSRGLAKPLGAELLGPLRGLEVHVSQLPPMDNGSAGCVPPLHPRLPIGWALKHHDFQGMRLCP